jgi:hypothetical protein
MPVPFRPDEIILPDVYSTHEVADFVTMLNGQLQRFGVKKLRKEAQSIYWHLQHIQRAEKEMTRLLRVVNGQPTPAQQHYYEEKKLRYEEKKLRTLALRFYNSLSVQTLNEHLHLLGLNAFDSTHKDEMVALLVDAHVKREVSGKGKEVCHVNNSR